MKKAIILVDGDVKRRASITFMLMAEGFHVEPFESVSELDKGWPNAAGVMIFDDEDSVGYLTDQMKATAHWLPIVAYATDPTPRRIANAVLAGAVDYVNWPSAPAGLRKVIEDLGGRALKHPAGADRTREARARARLDRLSKREQEVLALVAEGFSNRVIGQQLGISARTVEIHRSHILEKIYARSTSEAVRIAVESGLLIDNAA